MAAAERQGFLLKLPYFHSKVIGLPYKKNPADVYNVTTLAIPGTAQVSHPSPDTCFKHLYRTTFFRLESLECTRGQILVLERKMEKGKESQ